MFVKTTALPEGDKQIVLAVGTACQKLLTDAEGNAPLIVRGHVNRVSKPKTDDYILITPLSHVLLSTHRTTWHSEESIKDVTQPVRRRVQIDCNGENAATWAYALATCVCEISLLDIMKPFGVVPLWCESPVELTAADEGEQWHPRFMLELQVQVNPMTSMELESFSEILLTTKLI